MENQDNHRYDDIINLPNPTSKKHPRMSLYDRAAQFSPFAALTGHEAAIKETARQTDEKLMLSDEVIAELNEKLNLIAETIGTQQRVRIRFVGIFIMFKHEITLYLCIVGIFTRYVFQDCHENVLRKPPGNPRPSLTLHTSFRRFWLRFGRLL